MTGKTAPLPARRLRELARAVGDIVGRTAERVTRARTRLRPRDVTQKGVGDFVTTVDLRTEKQLRRELGAILPEAGWLGEETAAQDLDHELVWVVDPIDGTSNFARGLPHYAVAVALLAAGDPVVGVVHCQPENALYTAIRGGGANRERRRLRLPNARIDDAAMIGCQWHRGQQQLGFLAQLQQRGNRIRTLGSTVTQLADVAAGRLDANVQEQGKIWDVAAGGLLVEEAGGRFTDWAGRDVFPFAALTGEHFPSIAAGATALRQLRRLLPTR